MNPATLIAQYGLAAVFAGSLLEGETVLLLAGYSAHRGYLSFPAVLAIAMLGAVMGDQIWFALGRRQGARLTAQRPWLDTRVQRALLLIERHPIAIILAMRFAWGLRTALPIAVGMSRISWQRFLLLNLLSALVWAPLVAGTGYFFGALLARYSSNLHRVEHWGMLAILILALIVHFAARRRRRHSGGDQPTRSI
ncbi:MAG TPA: DedA family protein [Thiobacillus sp.]